MNLATAVGPILVTPGDLRFDPAPGGVGHARKPERYPAGGEILVAEIDGMGRLENRVVEDVA